MLQQQDTPLGGAADAAVALLDRPLLGTPILRWLIALGVVVGVLLLLELVRKVVLVRLARLAGRVGVGANDVVLGLTRATRHYFLLLLAVSAGMVFLDLPDDAYRVLRLVLVVGAYLQVGLWVNALVSTWVRTYTTRKASDQGSVTTIHALGVVARLGLWSMVVLATLGTLGVDVTALVTGLGIGGVAVALATQNILGDLFASLSIVLDKPFVVGDFIAVGEFLGTVEKVGLKTTRLRSLSGEQLIMANGDLLQSRLRNFKRMTERRVVFGFGVEYGTDAAHVERIPALVEEVIRGIERTRFDRAHFQRFGTSSLDFEVVYWVLSPEFNVYMDIQQRINLELLRRLRAMGVGLALPLQRNIVRDERQGLVPHGS